MKPAEERLAAAALLRRRAEGITTLNRGTYVPWHLVQTDSEYIDGVGLGDTDYDWIIETHHERIAAYLVAVQPTVALAVANVLEQSVYVNDDPFGQGVELDHDLAEVPYHVDDALDDLARAILSAGRQPAAPETDVPTTTPGTVTP